MNEKFKLKEAQYFYVRMEEMQNEREAFIYNLDALLAASRSALMFVREEAISVNKG